eukprot:scaffold318_cov396-Prasinococcus_capsulatus_cf.AAC.1
MRRRRASPRWGGAVARWPLARRGPRRPPPQVQRLARSLARRRLTRVRGCMLHAGPRPLSPKGGRRLYQGAPNPPAPLAL